jgi:hypothetical protein
MIISINFAKCLKELIISEIFPIPTTPNKQIKRQMFPIQMGTQKANEARRGLGEEADYEGEKRKLHNP